MKKLSALLLLCFSAKLCAEGANQTSQSLNSEELQQIKKKYENCVFENGRIILNTSNLRDAMEYAPMACRKELLQAKKYLLESAFKLDVIDQLVSSIEEGVKIDLAGRLIIQLKADYKGK
ncbi:MAG: hypothetical protein NWQ54_20010 [Paraglaciecola sp.]|uniref:hypothetical protein n=1 Tax=Paraglaciecola sp. TaxID=1920173 RepID=UPI00273E60CE|nr:hypothetical protein [Paraglaciecola sp.]MDP5031401.1 hypothetical protein [Paraglaciecola sp.]MDP5133173.1 hypothetical protein [Paraglaciecola sp.]